MASPNTRTIGPTPPPQDRRINLRILSPGQGVAETVEIRDVPLSITIEALKQRITLVAPSRPPVAHQRLIFAGRVLANNAARLEDALADAPRHSDTLTIHMITRGPEVSSQSQPVTRTATPRQTGDNAPAPSGASTTHLPGQAGQPQALPAHGDPQVGNAPIPPVLPHAPVAFGVVQGLAPGQALPFPAAMPLHQFQRPGHPGLHIGPQVLPHPPQHEQLPVQNSAQRPGEQNAQTSGPEPQVDPMAAMQQILEQQHEAIHQAAHQAAMHQQMQGGNPQPAPIVQRIHAQWRTGPGPVHPFQQGGHPQIPVFAQHPQLVPGQFVVPVNQPQVPRQPAGPQSAPGQTQDSTLPQSQPPLPQDRPAQTTATPFPGPPIVSAQQHARDRTIPFPIPGPFPRRGHFGLPGQGGYPISTQALAQSYANIQAQAQLASAPASMYLLSSPSGPQALLYHDSRAYTAQLPHFGPQPTTGTAPPIRPAQQPQVQAVHPALAEAVAAMPAPLAAPLPAGAAPPPPAAAAAAAAAAIPAPADLPAAAALNQDMNLNALMGPFWFLFRVLLFTYFFVGSDDGWRRTVIMASIGALYWVLRAVFTAVRENPRGPRREGWQGWVDDARDVGLGWWEGMVGFEARPARADAQGQQQGAGPGQGQAQANQQDRGGQQEPLVRRLRQRVRPLERALALFVASLWPGVGEGTIRARREREEEERRRQAELERSIAAPPQQGEADAEQPETAPLPAEGGQGVVVQPEEEEGSRAEAGPSGSGSGSSHSKTVEINAGEGSSAVQSLADASAATGGDVRERKRNEEDPTSG